MALYSSAIQKPVGWANRAGQKRKGNPNIAVLHVAVSESSSLHGFFDRSINNAPVCSHFYVRRNGIVEQYIDTAYVSAAERAGSPRAISIETQGGVNNPDAEQWTVEQVGALAALLKWINTTHPTIPLTLTADSATSTAGVSWHRRGIKGNFGAEGNKYAFVRGETWSGFGKLCPGLGKIKQIAGIVAQAKGGKVEHPPAAHPAPPSFSGDASAFVGKTITIGRWYNYKTAANAKAMKNPQRVMPAGQYRVDRVSAGQPHLTRVGGGGQGWVHSSVLTGLTTSAPAPKPSAKKTVGQVAQDIVVGRGGWGNGADRVKKLKAAGYNASAVQAEVNRILGIANGPSLTVSQMATQVIRGDHGFGHANRQRSLGVSDAVYALVRAEVNRRV